LSCFCHNKLPFGVRSEQRKVIKYNHLVANMVILHNVVGLSNVIKQLQDDGWEITKEMLAGLGPLRPGRINRFGEYAPDFRKKLPSLNFTLPIKPTES
jgi:hypothetical protein